MHCYGIRTLTLTAKVLVLIFLLFGTAEIAFSQGAPELRINDVSLTEGDTNGAAFSSERVEISLSAPSANTVTVTLSTQPGTAQSNVDFVAGSTPVTFQPGQTLQLVDVFTKGDTDVEGDEQFFLNLSNPVNATIADGQSVATIIDDDALILLTQPSSQRAAALDSVLFTKETFPITNTLNFSSDSRTRLSVFAIGWKGLAVTATAEDSQGTVFPLTVEFVDKLAVGNTPKAGSWLTQVVLKMPEPNQIPGAQDLKIRISSGQTSNFVLVAVS